eukprot:6214110-Pleurochrysis_carterae.AAC.12
MPIEISCGLNHSARIAVPRLRTASRSGAGVSPSFAHAQSRPHTWRGCTRSSVAAKHSRARSLSCEKPSARPRCFDAALVRLASSPLAAPEWPSPSGHAKSFAKR